MPYIHIYDRELHKELLEAIKNTAVPVPGHMNFLITALLSRYLEDNGKSYQTYNELIGVLECAKLELYRRLIGPYEDTKIKENGDVY